MSIVPAKEGTAKCFKGNSREGIWGIVGKCGKKVWAK
jgi:hypothetical protein